MKDYQCLKGMIEDSKNKLKTAYDKGYNHAIRDTIEGDRERMDNIRKDSYERGVNDMFDALTKLTYDTRNGGYSGDEIEEIFGTTYEPEILKKFADNPLLLIENIKEYEDNKTKQESDIHCHYLNRTCPYDIPCLTCDVCKAFEMAMEKAKENDNA